MKKIVLYTLGLLLAFFTHAQNIEDRNSLSVEVDSMQMSSINLIEIGEKSPETLKLQADSAYMNNDYTTSIQLYETILNKGESAEIYYNLGNSYYKSDDIAHAILNYERALLLKPGNDDIRANLEVARNKTVDKVEIIPDIFFIDWIKSLINSTSVDVWAIWGISFFLFFIGALILFFFSKKVIIKKIGFIAAISFLFCVISTNIFASYQKSILTNRNTAIVTSPSITVRSTPNETGTSLFILHEGHKVIIKDNSMQNWKEISLEDGKVGWISSNDIEII